jgi:uncharacterized protein YgbK (DUF1537 family)
MAATVSRVLTIIADDLTGACDTGCLFAGRGPVGVEARPVLAAPDRAVVAVDTESRARVAGVAATVLRATAERLRGQPGPGAVFKKIDSTMRGAVAAEITALLEHGPPFSAALVCPAFPAQQRVVSHGHLLVGSVPVHESPIGRDPAFRASTSELVALLAGGAPVVPLGLDEVRAGSEKIAHVLRQHPGALVAADGETEADLASLAAACLAVPGTLAAGSAGLGRALSRALGLAGSAVALPPGKARLVVVGSLHPVSRAQLDALARAGVTVVRADGRGHEDPEPARAALAAGRPAVVASAPTPASRGAVTSHLARATAAVLEGARPDLVAVTGGDTSYALLQALGPGRFDLLGAPADGLALGRLVLADGRELSLLTKAGGFGPPDLFTTVLGGTS